MSGLLPIQTILVPHGAEYQAVRRGLRAVSAPVPTVVPIPVGPAPVRRFLEHWYQAEQDQRSPQSGLLLMGLCGSLQPKYGVGAVALYQDCLYAAQPGVASQSAASSALLLRHACDPGLTAQIYLRLKNQAMLVTALTSDRLLYAAQAKRQLAEMLGADVVDMEGFTALEFLSRAGFPVATLRVVSDDCQHDLPDLTPAISTAGNLQPLPLALGMIRQPIAAARLIRGSLKGLKILQAVTTMLFTNLSLPV